MKKFLSGFIFVVTAQASAELNVVISCSVGPTQPARAYQIYTLGKRLIARTAVEQPNICLSGGCGGSNDVYYEGVLGNSPIILERSKVEYIQLSKMPERKGQVLSLTSTHKGDSRFGERDSITKMSCRVGR